MNQYIRDFEVDTTDTYTLANYSEAKEVLNINNNVNNFKILHNNIRSLNKNLDEFKIILQGLDSDLDVVIFTETWKIADINLYQINGYDVIYNYGDYNQNDGTVAYIRSNLYYTYSIEKINNITILNIKIKLNKKSNVSIQAMYRPPSTDPNEFNKNLQNYLDLKSREVEEYNIFVGDINIDLLQQNDHVNEYLSILNEFGYVSTINGITRSQGNQNSCIDHIFLKSTKNIQDLFLMPLIIHTDITDHYTVILQIILNSDRINSDSKGFSKIVDYKKLQETLSRISWDRVYLSENTESATKHFISIILNAINDCTTFKRNRRKNSKKTPWITNALVKSVHTKNLMFKNLQKDPNNVQLQIQYKNYKNRLTALIKKTKNQYYSDKIKNNISDSKNLWKVVQEITKAKTKTTDIQSIKNEEGLVLSDKKEISNEFIKTFTKMGKTLASKIKRDANYNEKKFISPNSFFLRPTDSLEIKKIITELSNNKSAGIDHLRAETLKLISNYIIEPFAFIINKCMETGVWPSAFKESLIIPIYKSGNTSYVQNYRPISLITNLTKVFEKVIKMRLNSYIKKFNLISEKQFGFKENVSAQDAILELTTKIYSALDKNKPCLCAFIDLSKAFDTVSHDLLLQTLEDIGIRDKCLDLFASYLNNRIQCARVNGVLSESLVIEYGVPQGTVLGPLLFSIYVNGLFLTESRGDIITFADDTAIFYKANSWEELKSIAETDISNIKKWFDNKLLTINFEKTFYLPFSCNKTKLPSFQQLNITTSEDQFAILPKAEIKYLGIIIDHHLKWNAHISYIIKKLQFLLHRFKCLQKILNVFQMKNIYHALIESHLNYGIIGWGGVAKTHLISLESIQKKFLKIMLSKNLQYPSDLLYKEAQIFDLRQLFYFHLNIKQHNRKHLAILRNYNYDTRQKDKYLYPLMSKTIGQRSYEFLAPKLYNTVPKDIRNVRKIHLFKKKLKQYMLQADRKIFTDYIDIKNK